MEHTVILFNCVPFQIGNLSLRKEFAPKGSEFFPIRDGPYSMENQFYHIRWPPLNGTTVNLLYNDNVCSKLSLTLKWICCYKKILTSTRFPLHNYSVKNIVQMVLFQLYASVKFHIASKCTKLPSYQMRQKPVHAKDLVLITKVD